MKGILICGGTGSRLRPLTDVTNKSLLPVYDKPLVLYPLETLRQAGITDIAVITGPEHIDQVTSFLGSGSRFGCTFAYRVQEKPGGIAEALGLAEEFADGESVCAILGDNVFFDDFTRVIAQFEGGGHVFLKEVPDPERFGVAEIDASKTADPTDIPVLSLEEKPAHPRSRYAVTGCYLYDTHCFEIIRNLAPSARGELEITDVSAAYLAQGRLRATLLQEEWVDAGTFESLFRATEIARTRKLGKK
jgi:glucose-1-phosphate thymidylyltransferase